MPDPTNSPDYSSLKKEQLLEELAKRDASLADALAKLGVTQESLAELRAVREREKAEADRAAETLAARKAEREKAIADNDPPRLLGQIPVYLQDSPDDIVTRARAVFAGQVPPDRATKFRSDAHFTAGPDWPLAKRLKTRAIPLGTEIDAAEIPREEILELCAAGALIAIG